jgi:hypothetical protein
MPTGGKRIPDGIVALRCAPSFSGTLSYSFEEASSPTILHAFMPFSSWSQGRLYMTGGRRS